MTDKNICGILLAAGESQRMGFPKPLLKIKGRTFIEHLSALMLERLPLLLIVLGAHAEQIRASIPGDSRIREVVNPDYIRGQLSSLKSALRVVGSEIDAVTMHLCDHPAVQRSTLDALIQSYVSSPTGVVIPQYENRRGHPVIFDRSLFSELLSADENLGARSVVNKDPKRVRYVEVNDPGIRIDLDTPEDLARAGLRLPAKN